MYVRQRKLSSLRHKAKALHDYIQGFLLCGKGDYPRCASMIKGGAYTKKPISLRSPMLLLFLLSQVSLASP